ncbi:selenocysteine-specific translation elongation factor [uncultured Cetobacterium sp.]|uniref:selenocysteine-specific translation elongation factor n=1 Tax=uncultured Cetobacterium sp. TaxID=527638 RepID=UPI0026351727|nr:selenocysteine-specific translation elongation factor [uncultured Cetobacterium sp.]
MKNIVIGTAGHIDHGKTSLVKKLTGIDTDVLPDEIRKGITINIGFSYIDNPRGGKIGIIDVPGHEKFIKNMVAGANGIQYLLMVIACDDGIMQQTIEHFNICKFLGIKYGTIVLTKSDLCSGERIEEVKEEIREYFKDSFLEGSEIFETSIKNIESYDNLKSHIIEQVNKINFATEEDKNFRMSVDRVFGVKGFGAVVTGTSQNNKVSIGDSVMIYPKKIKTKVKSIENHGKSLEVLEAGNRCALNLSGIEISDLSRGDILSKNFNLESSKRIDCYLQLLKTCKSLKNNSQVRLNIGTKEILAKIKIFGKNKLDGGESSFIQLELKEEFVGLKNDLGILRSVSPIQTLGGIRVINTSGEITKRTDEEYIDKLKVLSNGDLLEQIKLYLKEKRGVLVTYIDLLEHFSFLNNISEDTNLLNNIDIEVIEENNEKFYVYKKYIEDLKINIKSYFEDFYKNNSLKLYLPKAEIKNKYFKNIKGKDFNTYLNYLEKIEFLNILEDKIALFNHKVTLNKEQKKLKDDILVKYKDYGFNPEKTKQISNLFLNKKEFDNMVYYLIEKKLLVFLGDDTNILAGFYKESEKKLREYFQLNKELRLKDFRTFLETNRRMALLILEKFDSLKITQKIDDYRILRS